MKKDNIKYLHRKGGIIRFIINGENRFEQTYVSKEVRTNIIKYFQMYNKGDVVIEIIPNWDIWNGKY